MTRRDGPTVISPAGRRTTRTVGLLRLAWATSTGACLVTVSRIYAGASQPALSVAVGFAVLAGLAAVAEMAIGGRGARAEERRIRADLLNRYYRSSPGGGDGRGPTPAAVIQLMTDNAERLTEFRQIYLGSALAALLVPVFTLIYIAVAIDPVVGLGVLGLVPLIPVLLGGFMRFFRKTSAASRDQRSRLAGRYLDAIRNLVTIRLFGAGPRVEADLRARGETNRRAIMRLLAGNQIVIIVMDGLFALILICVTAALTVSRADQLRPGEPVAVMLLTILLLEPLQQVAGFFYIGMGGLAAQKAIRTHLATGPSPAGERQPSGCPAPESPAASRGANLAVELRDVHLDYGRGPVLAGVDLAVPVGARVAIVGRSGAGKSTLLGLVRGALVADRGLVAVAGQDLSQLDSAAARSLSATVAQTTWLFTETIAENLRVARPDATDEDLWAALEAAQVADEIRRMPSGLQTAVGEGATLISGGQAQRISLARALLSGRRLLLLDEPTSQVDIESEARIIAAVAALPRDRTVIMVTHRRSLLAVADQTWELANGRLLARETSNV